MKRTVGTLVLFILLILTVAALTQIDGGRTSAASNQAASSQAEQ